MAYPSLISRARNIAGLLAVSGLMLMAPLGLAQAADEVTTYKDEKGWKLRVNGEDFYVKGFVWDYKPPGTNYSYDLYGQSDEFIKALIDHEFGLMKAAGVTATRSFVRVPPKWVTYIYETYGIMTVVNPLMGRYGFESENGWVSNTDYSDPATRETLKRQVLEIVEQYVGVPGVLMIALGNESNYGLSWSSFEIENLPVGEQHREKAKYLYSLFDEVIQAARELDPTRLYTIVNGDIQYLDLIAEYGKDWDLLGVNAYRGISFEDPANNVSLWRDVEETLGLPVVFMEFGSDAFNAREFREDQDAQASYLRGQWHEIYRKSYGNGEEGNALGGFVFEWRDEWWKYRQTENLDVQDRTASWSNGGYRFDHVEGQNNMNEEWFGVARIGEQQDDGVYVAETRMAYDVLREIWRIDPYDAGRTAINEAFADINMEFYSLKNLVRALDKQRKEKESFQLVGGSFRGEMLVQGFDSNIEEDGEDGLDFDDGLMANFDFAFQPTDKIKGDFTINLLANVAQSNFEFRYGDRGLPITVEVIETEDAPPGSSGSVVVTRTETEIEDNERIEIYDFQATYTDLHYDLEFFYHVPRYHWYYEGDFFGLLPETTDMAEQDIWNQKAPYGFEYIGKRDTYGLKVLAGPEIYWGANPRAMVKYEWGGGARADGTGQHYAFVFAEDIARREEATGSTEATVPQSRQASLYGRFNFDNGSKLELGGMIAGTEKDGDEYDRIEGDDIVLDEVEFEDTLALKARYEFGLGPLESYVQVQHAGLVADSVGVFDDLESELPWSELGNKQVIDAGFRYISIPHMIYPRVMYRNNLVDSNPTIAPSTGPGGLNPGIDPRNRDDDPFAVLGNREVAAAELVYTYDPTFGTWFYDWDIDMKEDAPFAFNISLTLEDYKEETDANLFFFEEGGFNAPFGSGLTAEELWLLKSKMIWNPRPGLRTILNVYTGEKQSTGAPSDADGNAFDTVEFFSIDGKMVVDNKHIYEAYIKVDDFGPYDFQEQFNIVYPLQLKFEYARLLDLAGEEESSKWGVRAFYRELDELSGGDFRDGENDYMLEVQTYFELRY